MTVGTKRETCCLLNQFIFSKIAIMKPNGVHNADDISEVLKAILTGLFLHCRLASPATDDVKSDPLNRCVECCIADAPQKQG